MQATESVTLASLVTHLEELWRLADELMDSLRPAEWCRKHGRDWRFADVPFHLAYFDDEVVARAIARGADVPACELKFMRTHGEFNAWNERKLAERPAHQTVAQSLAQMRASRAAIRHAVARLRDADLERPVWIALPPHGGWRTVRFALGLSRMHLWAHLTIFRLRLKRDKPVESPAITHAALDGIIRSFPALLNRARAAQTHFTVVMRFAGAGGGAWTLQITDGVCAVMEGQPAHADLVMTQSPATFAALLGGMRHPALALLSGQVKIRHWQNVHTFARLFPRPNVDQPLAPVS